MHHLAHSIIQVKDDQEKEHTEIKFVKAITDPTNQVGVRSRPPKERKTSPTSQRSTPGNTDDHGEEVGSPARDATDPDGLR